MGCGSSAEIFENAGVFTDDDINKKVLNMFNANPNRAQADKDRLLEYIYFLFLRKNYEIILENIQMITRKEKISHQQNVELSNVTTFMSFLKIKFEKLMEQEKLIEKEREIVDRKISDLEIKISRPNSRMVNQSVSNTFKKEQRVSPVYQPTLNQHQRQQRDQKISFDNVNRTRDQPESSLSNKLRKKQNFPSQEIQMQNYTPTIKDSFIGPTSYSLPDKAADFNSNYLEQSEESEESEQVNFLQDRIKGLQDHIIKLTGQNQALKKQINLLEFQNKRLQDIANTMTEEKSQATQPNSFKSVNFEEQAEQLDKIIQEKLRKQVASLRLNRQYRLGITKADEISILNYKKTPVIESPSFIEVLQTNETNQEESEDMDSLKKDKRISIMFNLFSNSKILPNHKQFQTAVGVRRILAEMFTDTVKSTELLYQYDHINPLHYEKYIDKAENVMLLIQLPNNYVIGGFAGKVEGSTVADSFIFSLNPHREPIKLTPSQKIYRINRDSSYLSFGFDEINIKAKSLSVMCNVSGFRTMFSQKGRSVHIETFLGFEKREFTAQNFEIYRINFKSNEDLKSVVL